jgi:hypothetical protein
MFMKSKICAMFPLATFRAQVQLGYWPKFLQKSDARSAYGLALLAACAASALPSTVLGQGTSWSQRNSDHQPPGWEPGPSYIQRPPAEQGNFAGIGQIGAQADPLLNPAASRHFPLPPSNVIYTPGGRFDYHHGRVRNGAYVAPHQPRYVHSGTNVNINYRDRNWNLQLQMNGGNAVEIVDRWCGPRPRCASTPIYGPSPVIPYYLTYYPAYGYSRYGYSNYVFSNYLYAAPVAVGPSTYGYDPRLVGKPAPASVPTLPPPATNTPQPTPQEITPLDVGFAAMHELRYDVAAEAFSREIVLRGENGQTLRYLALAYAAGARWSDAVITLRQAHRIDPSLAASPILPAEIGLDEARTRTLTMRAVTYAHSKRSDPADSWLLVATLMKAQRRHEVAWNMVQRAKGLEPEITESFRVSAARAAN